MQTTNLKAKEVFKTLVFTENEIKFIESVFHEVIIGKGDLLIKPSDIVHSHYFISEGCLRTFYLDSDGKEHTIQFGIKNWWISDYTAFFTTKKAMMTVEAIEDSVLYRISKKDIELLCEKYPKVNRFYRIKLEYAYSEFQKRILAIISQTARKRYLRFINLYPEIEKHVKNYHIASYLGITTESLSRIRKELSERKIS